MLVALNRHDTHLLAQMLFLLVLLASFLNLTQGCASSVDPALLTVQPVPANRPIPKQSQVPVNPDFGKDNRDNTRENTTESTNQGVSSGNSTATPRTTPRRRRREVKHSEVTVVFNLNYDPTTKKTNLQKLRSLRTKLDEYAEANVVRENVTEENGKFAIVYTVLGVDCGKVHQIIRNEESIMNFITDVKCSDKQEIKTF
ncbi:hypothetical protein RB195_012066 [Necator americanus]|uniref:Uncharacterized protein n=1 Tax=Necator americanus TaxID=51031 RepID=A0ABR1D674_NECAM